MFNNPYPRRNVIRKAAGVDAPFNLRHVQPIGVLRRMFTNDTMPGKVYYFHAISPIDYRGTDNHQPAGKQMPPGALDSYLASRVLE